MSLRKADPEGETAKVAVVKKYANRRLYNTATSCYVTLDELSQMVRKGEDFVVYDAKTGEDITRSVLTQIILEEDSKGRNLLPISFLRQLISFYDDSLQSFLPRYLELSMENFARNQEQMRGYMEQTFGRFFPLNQFEDMARQNMALFQRAASMWHPFPGGEEEGQPAEADAEAKTPRPVAAAEKAGSLDSEMRELKSQMESLQRQLDALQRDQKPPVEAE
jgi:polyhydroxyalkanoate synthesis repressor PhaR